MLFLLLFLLGKMKGLERSHTNVNTQHPRRGRQMLGKDLCGQPRLTDLEILSRLYAPPPTGVFLLLVGTASATLAGLRDSTEIECAWRALLSKLDLKPTYHS